MGLRGWNHSRRLLRSRLRKKARPSGGKPAKAGALRGAYNGLFHAGHSGNVRASRPDSQFTGFAKARRWRATRVSESAAPRISMQRPLGGVRSWPPSRPRATSGLPWVVIGGGTNLVVADAGFRGIVLRFTAASLQAGRQSRDCGRRGGVAERGRLLDRARTRRPGDAGRHPGLAGSGGLRQRGRLRALDLRGGRIGAFLRRRARCASPPTRNASSTTARACSSGTKSGSSSRRCWRWRRAMPPQLAGTAARHRRHPQSEVPAHDEVRRKRVQESDSGGTARRRSRRGAGARRTRRQGAGGVFPRAGRRQRACRAATYTSPITTPT